MGRKTLYHPISLHVIRGAAEYCGWRFGVIKQVDSSPTGGAARYFVTVAFLPSKFRDKSVEILQAALQNCFMDDIRVKFMRRTRSGTIMCDLVVTLKPEPTQQPLRIEPIEESGS